MQYQNSTQQAPFRFIDIKEVRQLVCLGKSTIWNRVKAGTFPKPFKLGGYGSHTMDE